MGLGSIIGGIGSAVIGASSANKAAKAQKAAAANQLALEGRIYDETVERFEPFLQGGLTAQNALAYELGLGPKPMIGGQAPEVVEFQDTPADTGSPYRDPTSPYFASGRDRPGQYTGANTEGFYAPSPVTKYRVGNQVFNSRDAADAYATANPTGGTEYRGFEATPFQEYVLDETQQAVDGSAASRGNLFSGATIKAQQDRANSLTGGFFQAYLDRLTNMSGQGQAAAGNAANAGANYAAGAGQAYGAMGNASSAGAIGVGNALNSGINNAIGIWNYQKQQNPVNQLSVPQFSSGSIW